MACLDSPGRPRPLTAKIAISKAFCCAHELDEGRTISCDILLLKVTAERHEVDHEDWGCQGHLLNS